MAGYFNPRGMPLGGVQGNSRHQNWAAMEILPGRVVGLVNQLKNRESEKRSSQTPRIRDSLKGLQRFAAIAESAAMSAYRIAMRVATSGRGWYRQHRYYLRV